MYTVQQLCTIYKHLQALSSHYLSFWLWYRSQCAMDSDYSIIIYSKQEQVATI